MGGDTNLYGYSLVDPISLIDPDGEAAALLIPVAVLLFVIPTAVNHYSTRPSTIPWFKMPRWGGSRPERRAPAVVDTSFGTPRDRVKIVNGPLCNTHLNEGNDGSDARHSPEQAETVKKAKRAKKTGVSRAEGEALVEEAKSRNIRPARLDEGHPKRRRRVSREPHLHIGPVNHIPVK